MNNNKKIKSIKSNAINAMNKISYSDAEYQLKIDDISKRFKKRIDYASKEELARINNRLLLALFYILAVMFIVAVFVAIVSTQTHWI